MNSFRYVEPQKLAAKARQPAGRVRTPCRVLVLVLLALAELDLPASAHEKWFIEAGGRSLRWDMFFQPLPLAFVTAVLLVTLLARLWWRQRGRGFVPGPEAFGATLAGRSAVYGLAPFLLGIHVAVPLLVDGVQGQLFSPDNVLPNGIKYLFGLAETAIALAIFYGVFTRFAALVLAALWIAGLFLAGVQPMLDNLLYLGFAGFFFCAGRGPLALDRVLLPRLEPTARLMERAVPILRAGVGLSFVVVAFTEKFANLPLAYSFLERYPLNCTAAFGVPLSNELFVLCAGAVELLLGLWLVFGIFPREIIVAVWVPINLTLTIFSWKELIGHLPIYAALAILLLWEPGPENLRFWRSGLRDGPLAIPDSPLPPAA